MKFYDRKSELALLQDIEQQSFDNAMFTVLMGRRRVGKTSLITQFFDGKEYAYLFVSKDSEALLCQNFQRDLESQIGLHAYGEVVKFRDLFEMIMKEAQHRHLTIVIDEFQNLYKVNPVIFSDMQNIWDRYKRNAKINLIVLGSIQTLMKRIFEDQSEPLYGRPTAKFVLRPFAISVMKEILHDVHPNYSAEDLLCLYAVTGGVAKYIELMVDAKCYTKEKMLNFVCRQDSYFLTEGKDLLNQEFSGDFSTYFSILQVLSAGKTKRSEIDSTLHKDVGTFLQNLESKYELICRMKPLFAKQNGKVTAYEIRDNFLRFWFRFIYPYQSLIERNLFSLLRSNITNNYEGFTGRTLELYFQDKVMETGCYTQVGNWWDRKGQNEIDLIAVNEFDHTGVVAEIKRNPHKISMQKLQEKVEALPKKEFGSYSLQKMALSLEDM